MKRTLLAIGLAVLASMLFAPHHDHWSVLDGVRWKSHHEAYYTERTADMRWERFPQVNSQTIDVAGHGSFDFPREMTPDQIRDVLRKKFPSDKEIVFKAANPYDRLLAATDKQKHTQSIGSGKTFDFDPTTARPLNDADDLGFQPLVTVYHPAEDFYYQPDWVDEWKWYPAFWPASSLLLTPFIAQTVFLSILVAVLANWRKRART